MCGKQRAVDDALNTVDAKRWRLRASGVADLREDLPILVGLHADVDQLERVAGRSRGQRKGR